MKKDHRFKFLELIKHFLLITLIVLPLSGCNSESSSGSPTINPQFVPSSTAKPGKVNPGKANPTPTLKPTIDKAAIIPTISIQKMEFLNDSANRSIPEDVFKEVSFFGIGGRPTNTCNHEDKPTVVDYSDPTQRNEEMFVKVCGWSKDEKVTAFLKGPSGQEEVFELSAGRDFEASDFAVQFYFDVPLDYPNGVYQLHFKGRSGEVTWKAQVISPVGPKVKYLSDSKQYFLYNFEPAEEIRVFAYTYSNSNSSLVFSSWQSFRVNSEGQMILAGNMDYEFGIIGDQSGVAKEVSLTRTFYKGNPVEPKVLCPDSAPSRMIVGNRGRVTFSTGQSLRVRSNYGKAGEVIAKFDEGDEFEVVDGPECSDGYTWWKIIYRDIEGWVAEGTDDNYFIEPITAN